MKFIIKNEIVNNFLGLNIGVVLAKGLDNRGELKEINDLLRDAENRAISEFSQFESSSQHPNIIP